MKSFLSADRLFFTSALVSVVSFLISIALWYLWPMPVDDNYIPKSTDPDQILYSVSWFLAWAGVGAFVLGCFMRLKR